MTRFAPAALVALALAGCTDGGGSIPFEPPATVILVEPTQFLGSVRCEETPGAMRRYVATLFDVTSPRGGRVQVGAVALPSSEPAPCHLGVRFANVTPGHRYTAEIDGYDREDVRPFTPGGRVMEDDDGIIAAPRWTTACAGGSDPAQSFFADGGIVYDTADASAEAGADAAPSDPDLSIAVMALEQYTVPMRACAPLEDIGGGPGQTGLVVDLSTALVGQECGDAPGMVSTFTASVRETGETQSARCDAPLEFTGLVDGTAYTIDVVAEAAAPDAGSAPPSVNRWTTMCYGVAAEGLLRRAACDPLRNVL